MEDTATGNTVFEFAVEMINKKWRVFAEQFDRPRHLFNGHRGTSAFSLGIIGNDIRHPFFTGNDIVHNTREFFPFGCTFPPAVFN
ncbi:MAG: hypothetical protein LBQ10_10095, partial [Desulfovibrio sp.]|nr:hypothetical protein [Desulfovibrio sp.]